ncbi:phosphonate ABC transporter substrate-binding protein [Limobrevibacterium gyesilva]|uniref:Phosphonate ABC transporter substrate-binding protein n=1 Tax=Limobrevibacterium gyesilva TaxID=2991712 RepID=A0AA42CGB2_9PROT|nr:phosphonate ABC transporter substrate-binding protein [Limobrevibacterium gyesilva]MCW3477514.1 phosphonate ABC transporter substrate-binding protein [Limobrevibacterium gyesilva]
MIQRRTLLAGVAAGAVGALAAPARAQSWKAQYPELVYAVVPAENASGVTERYGAFVAYLGRELGTKVTLRIANDYAAVIEGQRSGNIHVGSYGPASFARARLTGVKTDAFVIDVNGDGTKGYNSVFYVLAKSPYRTIEDLKGRNLGLVDPNSTSGYNMPLFALNKQGITAATFFGKVQVTGSHENAVIALAQGTVDVCANWWNADDDSNLTRMLAKGMVKGPDGKALKKEDFRIILKSDLIINSPNAMLSDLPAELKAAIRKAFLEAPVKDKAAFDRLSDGKGRPWEPVDNAAYDDTIKLIQFVDALRKRSA